MPTQSLRAYFSWRTKVRRGEYRFIPSSVAYLYVYELLNGVGASSPEDALQKMKVFLKEYVLSGVGEKKMESNLKRWALEYAMLSDLPAEIVKEYLDDETRAFDEAAACLKTPNDYDDEKVFSSLVFFADKKFPLSPAIANERSKRIIANAWRAAEDYRKNGKSLFSLCFGNNRALRCFPLSNALYYSKDKSINREYELTSSRVYSCKNGAWYVKAYEKSNFDKKLFGGFIHEVDVYLRRYFGSKRKLTENPSNAWAAPYITAAIEIDKRELVEASRAKIDIDFSELEQIRKDSIATRDSLLTQEDVEQDENETTIEEINENVLDKGETETPSNDDEKSPLSEVQKRILKALLDGEEVNDIIKENRMMASIVADEINEALFDIIGDTALLCEDDKFVLIDDYVDELRDLVGE